MTTELKDPALMEDLMGHVGRLNEKPDDSEIYNESTDDPSGLEPVVLHIKTEIDLTGTSIEGTGYYTADAYAMGVDVTSTDSVTNTVAKHTNVLVFVPDIAGTGVRGAVSKDSLVLGFPMYQSLTVATVKELGMTTTATPDSKVLSILTYYVVQTLSLMARLTVDNGNGTYDAVEQYWSSGAWADRPNGMVFNHTDFPRLMEVNQVTGLKVGTGGEIVEARPIAINFADTIDAGYVFRAPTNGNIPAIVNYQSSGSTYYADLYRNGYSSSETDSDVLVEILNLNPSEVVPSGTKLIVTIADTDFMGVV